jgi:hypothetical protein
MVSPIAREMPSVTEATIRGQCRGHDDVQRGLETGQPERQRRRPDAGRHARMASSDSDRHHRE